MISRRTALTLIAAAPLWASGQAQGETTVKDHRLSVDMESATMAALLQARLKGQPKGNVGPALEALGARHPMIEDLAESGLEKGYDLGNGVRAGDPVLVVNFGLRQGWFRADRPVVAMLRYEGGVIAEALSVAVTPK